MKILYFECAMGAAGDMLTAALLELLPNPDKFIEELNGLGIPGVEYIREKSEKCGICGTHISVKIHGSEEGEEMYSLKSASTIYDIEDLVFSLPVSIRVKNDIIGVYRIIAEAESRVHGTDIKNIHFHEVGSLDAIADVTAVCMLLERLAPERILASAVHVGSGTVKCAHGILPVPAPATACILKDVPVYGGKIKGELCTPTGAALLKHFAEKFGDMPVMRVEAIGYGMGRKDFEEANCVRAILGDSADFRPSDIPQTNQQADKDAVIQLNCNVDDMTAEDISYAMDKIFEAGAVEVFTTPVGMKKCRPGTMITVICREDKKENVISAIFKHTSTIGIREELCRRYVLERRIETENTEFGPIRKKISFGYGTERKKYEHDDLEEIADNLGISIAELKSRLINE